MRVALISDLHGNEVALRAVLDDIARVGIDRLVCLGDVATLGPCPGAVIKILRELGCTCIMGNHDEFLLDSELIRSYTEVPPVVAAVDWCRDQIDQDALEFLRSFVRSVDITLDNGIKLFLFHGSPRSHMEDILATTPVDQLDQMLDGHHATVMAGGHTHIQMLRQHRGILLVNPGSVGAPFREYAGGKAPVILPHAEYAIIEEDEGAVRVHLQRVALDKRALRDAIASTDNPLRDAHLVAYS